MAKSASVIEINGNRYDAVSGQLLGAVKKMANQMAKPGIGAIDGLVRKPAMSFRAQVSSRPAAKTKPSSVSATRKNQNVRRQLERSRTLMRASVKRPTALTVVTSKKLSDISVRKSSAAFINPVRASRAKTIKKNAGVLHFGKPVAGAVVTRPQKSLAAQTVAKPVISQTSPITAQLAKPLPSLITSISHQNLERLLDHALMQADAHKRHLKGRAKGWRKVVQAPKWITYVSIFLVVFLLGGFFAWQNIPQVSMRVAALRNHVSASVPAYTPSGFKFAAPITTNSGKVTINYKTATSTSSGFAITQQASNWNSTSVVANVVPAGSQVQTSQLNGTTIYIFGKNNDARWVNHGILFSLDNKANLSSDQILKIANGL